MERKYYSSLEELSRDFANNKVPHPDISREDDNEPTEHAPISPAPQSPPTTFTPLSELIEDHTDQSLHDNHNENMQNTNQGDSSRSMLITLLSLVLMVIGTCICMYALFIDQRFILNKIGIALIGVSIGGLGAAFSIDTINVLQHNAMKTLHDTAGNIYTEKHVHRHRAMSLSGPTWCVLILYGIVLQYFTVPITEEENERIPSATTSAPTAVTETVIEEYTPRPKNTPQQWNTLPRETYIPPIVTSTTEEISPTETPTDEDTQPTGESSSHSDTSIQQEPTQQTSVENTQSTDITLPHSQTRSTSSPTTRKENPTPSIAPNRDAQTDQSKRYHIEETPTQQ